MTGKEDEYKMTIYCLSRNRYFPFIKMTMITKGCRWRKWQNDNDKNNDDENDDDNDKDENGNDDNDNLWNGYNVFRL